VLPPPPPPVVAVPDAAHLVRTAEGQRLALSVPVRARPAPEGRTAVHLRVTVRLPGGANLRPTPSTRQHVDRAPVVHRVLFSPASTRRLLRLAHRPKATVRAFAAHDGDGDGLAEQVSAPVAAVGSVPRLARRPPAPRPAPLGPIEGPCGAAAGLEPAGCVTVGGIPWAAPHRWATSTWRLTCPAGTAAVDAATVATTSRGYELSHVAVGPILWVEVTDDDVAGHPVSYVPTGGCLPR
jgi:hypothetical protein